MASELKHRIEAARAYAGIRSQEELASRISMSSMTFKRRLHGDYPFKRGELLAIAEVCEVPVWFLERGFDVVIQDEAHRTSDNRSSVELAGQMREKDRRRKASGD